MQAYWINPMAWAQQALAINEFTAPRWNVPSLVPGLTLGEQLLSDHSYKTTIGYKWAGVAMVLFYTILLNCCIWLALAVLKGAPLHLFQLHVSAGLRRQRAPLC